MPLFNGFPSNRPDSKKMIGKRVASGTATSSSGTLSFQYVNGTTLALNYVSVLGLTFKPSLIFMISAAATSYATLYNEISDSLYPKTAKLAFYDGGAGGSSINMKGDTSNALVTSSSFLLPVQLASSLYTWIAYE